MDRVLSLAIVLVLDALVCSNGDLASEMDLLGESAFCTFGASVRGSSILNSIPCH